MLDHFFVNLFGVDALEETFSFSYGDAHQGMRIAARLSLFASSQKASRQIAAAASHSSKTHTISLQCKLYEVR